MEGMPGAPGMKMYSTEELMNSKKFGDEDADYEDDDDATAFASNLGKVLLEKQSKKSDWKQKITKRILDGNEETYNQSILLDTEVVEGKDGKFHRRIQSPLRLNFK